MIFSSKKLDLLGKFLTQHFLFAARYVPQPDAKEFASCINLISHDTAVRDIITRTYGCPITRLNMSPNVSTNVLSYEPHPNILGACVAIETNSTFYIFQVNYQKLH